MLCNVLTPSDIIADMSGSGTVQILSENVFDEMLHIHIAVACILLTGNFIGLTDLSDMLFCPTG